jgi:hypothetical protein
LFLVLGVITLVLSGLLGVILSTTGLATSAVQGLTVGRIPIAFTLINIVVETVIAAISGTLVASLYVQLRLAKEGPVTDTLADVFA